MTDRALRRYLLLIMLTLVGIGCIAVYSSTAIMANENYGHPLHFMVNHVIAIFFGAILAVMMLSIPDQALRRGAKWCVAGCILLLILVFLFGLEVGGARRWFHIGRFSLQPSEFSKLALIVYLADYLARKHGMLDRFRDGFLPPMLVAGLMAGLVLIQPDLGSAVVIGSVTLLLLVIAKARWQHVAGTAGLGAVALVVLIAREAYRMRRMLAFMNPWQDPRGAGFQIVQSYLAMAHGGLIGQGIGGSMQKLFYLPSAHTDFIFAILGEELGLFGSTMVLTLFGLFILCGIRMAMRAEDPFRKYLITGLVGLIGFEAIVHVAVVTGMMPTKGLPLPLISYGGTAMVANGIACGLIFYASKQPSTLRTERPA